jgi:hypothetical protein
MATGPHATLRRYSCVLRGVAGDGGKVDFVKAVRHIVPRFFFPSIPAQNVGRSRCDFEYVGRARGL